jgi:hypothetical protein
MEYRSLMVRYEEKLQEEQYSVQGTLHGIKQFAEDIGIDTNATDIGIIIETLEFESFLNESTGETIYLLEKFTAKELADRIKRGLGKADEYIADKARKFISSNLSHSYLQNKAAKEMDKLGKKVGDTYKKNEERLEQLRRMKEDEMTDSEKDELMDKEEESYKSRFEEIDRDIFNFVHKTTPLKTLIRKKKPDESDRDYTLNTLTSGLVPSQQYSNSGKGKGKNNNSFYIDPKTGEKKRAKSISLGHSGALVNKLTNNFVGQDVFVRNIDKPYTRKPDKLGRKDSLSRLRSDIRDLTRTYPHELRHAEDRALRGVERFKTEGITSATDYRTDPREIIARKTQNSVAPKMKYSWIPAVAKGVGENIYKKVTGRGTGSAGMTMKDTLKAKYL